MVGDFLVAREGAPRARIIICSDKPLSTAASNKSRHNGVARSYGTPLHYSSRRGSAPGGQCRQRNRNKTRTGPRREPEREPTNGQGRRSTRRADTGAFKRFFFPLDSVPPEIAPFSSDPREDRPNICSFPSSLRSVSTITAT